MCNMERVLKKAKHYAYPNIFSQMVTISPVKTNITATVGLCAPWVIGLLCVLLVLFTAHRTPLASSPIKIASIYASTGSAAHANRSSILGVRLAVKEINAAGGLLGRTVELLELDNSSTPIGSDDN